MDEGGPFAEPGRIVDTRTPLPRLVAFPLLQIILMVDVAAVLPTIGTIGTGIVIRFLRRAEDRPGNNPGRP